ncbi:hypothetical protein, partial [Methanomethylovorans sp.]|uniref:hypothetical protein n=1 Tax=Methanomethylovorans sp. TaxID=2758717 RepID=UPI00351C0670
MVAVLIALSGTACAAELTNPGIIHSGEVFTISNGDNLTLMDDDYDYLTVDLLIEAGGILVIESGGNLTIPGGSIANEGSINNSGTINGYASQSKIYNNGTFNNYGNIFDAYCVNYGIFYNEGYISLVFKIENHGTMENSGFILNEGSIDNFGNFYNSG